MSPTPPRPEWGRRPDGDVDGWEQMSAKKLVVGPLQALGGLVIPFAAALFGAAQAGTSWFSVAVVGFAVLAAVIGLVPWWTDRFRVTDTQFQFRKGLFERKTITVSLDRVRSVELEAKLLHRIVRLRTVQVGTGVDDERIELNALDTFRAEQLRRHLLQGRARDGAAVVDAVTPASTTPPAAAVLPPAYGSGAYGPDAMARPTPEEPVPEEPTGVVAQPRELAPRERLLAQIDWRWLRFAPVDLTRLAFIATAAGVIFQALGDNLVPDAVWEGVDSSVRQAMEWSIAVLVIVSVLSLTVLWILVAVLGYVLQWAGLKLTSSDGSLHLTHGLLNVRSISVEEKRIRGVRVTEPMLLRPLGGANLATLATGVDGGGVTRILPQAPLDVVRSVGEQVLDVDPGDALLTRRLTEHGPVARRRYHLMGQGDSITLLLLGWLAHSLVLHHSSWEPELGWFLTPGVAWIFLAPVLAELTYAHLGHRLTPTHLVVGGGTTTRSRTVLEVDGVIGWVVKQTWFQKRLGLCTLVATTAAGKESLTLPDVRHDVAMALMAAATPEAVLPFAA